MKSERLFADYQLAEMEHNAFKTEASAEKLELAKLAYENALAKEEEASVPKFESLKSIEPVQNTSTATALELLNMVGGFSEEERTEIIKSFVDRKFKDALTPEKHFNNFVDTKIKEALAIKSENVEPSAPSQSEAAKVEEEKKTV